MGYNFQNDVLLALTDWLMKKYNNIELLASLVPYLKAQREADLVMIKNNNLFAFEIKTNRDNLHKLSKQLEDYKSTFDYVYVVLDVKFKAREFGHNVGIITYNNGVIRLKQRALKNKADRFCQSLLISKRYKAQASQSVNTKNLIIKSLKDAYGDGYENFKKEKDCSLIIGKSAIGIKDEISTSTI